jgi:signal transduction histidine kinase
MADQPVPRRLSVSVQRDADVARLRISDTGAGISPEKLPHVFEPFFSGKPQGTGLGLAIAKHVLDAHGGRLALEPGAPRGTVATVELSAKETGR